MGLKEEVESERHQNFLRSVKEKMKKEKEVSETKQQSVEYPSEQIVQNNLVCRQVEFYFSDYNLKRDKRLLEKICAEPERGYLSVSEVLSLSRVRQLVNTSQQLYAALMSSPFVQMICETAKCDEEIKDDAATQPKPLFVGRRAFKPPMEKLFPFRRSVFIFGLPLDAKDEFVHRMLS